MTYITDKQQLLVYLAGLLMALLTIIGGKLWADVEVVKAESTVTRARQDLIIDRLDRIESKLDAILERTP